jgi:hypothetical protein
MSQLDYFTKTRDCSDFALRMHRQQSNQVKTFFYKRNESELFKTPMTGKNTDLIYVADNTYMFSCFMSYMNQTQCKNRSSFQTIILEKDMKVIYNIADRWFVLTIIFAVLNFIGILCAMGLAYLYKKKREEH